jgi:hypothetical protein
MYVTVSIGNTDNRLTQQEWNRFVENAREFISKAGKVHFFGGAPNWEPWQNVAWIVEVQPKEVDVFVEQIISIRKTYQQDSAFVMISEGLFL